MTRTIEKTVDAPLDCHILTDTQLVASSMTVYLISSYIKKYHLIYSTENIALLFRSLESSCLDASKTYDCSDSVLEVC